MSDDKAAFGWVAKVCRIAAIVSLAFLALVLTGTVAGAIVAAVNGQGPITVALWALGALAAVAMAIWIFVIYGTVQVLLANERAVTRAAAGLERAETLLENQAGTVRKLAAIAALSDQAKRLIYHDDEIDIIREAVHENILQQDYTAAETMIEAIEKQLGYADVAARLREEMDASRRRTEEEKIDAAVSRINEIIERRDWTQALREANRLQKTFPGNPKVASLPGLVTGARNEHKQQLLASYKEAVRKNDIDASIELLKELDLYLTAQEAAALQDSARGVFKTKLYNLGVRFALTVSEEQWADALATGQQIIQEYPNSRMAHEVREKLDLLRTKAAAAADTAQQQVP